MKLNKLKPRYIFISTIIIIISLISIMSFSNREIEIISEQGDIKEMGDVELIYYPDDNILSETQYKEVRINKDKIDVSNIKTNNLHQEYEEMTGNYVNKDDVTYLNTQIEHEYKNIICDVDNHLIRGTIYSREKIYQDNQIIDNGERIINIKIKNLESNKVSDINIEIEDEKLTDYDYEVINNTIYNNKLYITTIAFKEELEPSSRKINIFEVDIENKKYEMIKSIELNDDMDVIPESFIFRNENNIYINTLSVYSSEDKFLIYNLENNEHSVKEVSSIIGKSNFNIQFDVIDYYIEDNKLQVILDGYQNSIIHAVYELDNNKIELINYYRYELKNVGKDYHGSDKKYSITRFIDGKIYNLSLSKTILSKETKDRESIYIKGVKPLDLMIFDTEVKDVVYQAQLKNGDTNIQGKFYFRQAHK